MPKPARTTVFVSLNGRYANETRGWKLPLYVFRRLCGSPSWLAVTYFVQGTVLLFRLQALIDCWNARFEAPRFCCVRYPARLSGTTIEFVLWSKFARLP